MTFNRQAEAEALRRNAQQYEDAAEGHWDSVIAAALRKQAVVFRKQADELEKGSEK